MFAFILLIAIAQAADFKAWCAKHNKHFTAAEALRRRAIFNSNAKFASKFNAQNKFKLSVNGPFAAMTNAEYRQTLKRIERTMVKQPKILDIQAAESIDWRAKGKVPAVRDQGSCGSCYTFGSVAALEGRLITEAGAPVTIDLAEQQLVDCTLSYGNLGCNGGLGTNCFEYIIANGIAKESDFPYKEAKNTCSYKSSQKYAKMTGYESVTSKSVTQVKNALTQGMIDVSIDASSIKLQLYASGAYEDSSCATALNSLNHEVSAVGYGKVDGIECIIVRNSWGSSWGEDGYINMAMAANTCGVLTDPYYVTGVSLA